MLLQHSPAYEELVRELQGKRDSIEERFYITDAMVKGMDARRIRSETHNDTLRNTWVPPSYLLKENLPPGQPGVHMCFVQ